MKFSIPQINSVHYPIRTESSPQIFNECIPLQKFQNSNEGCALNIYNSYCHCSMPHHSINQEESDRNFQINCTQNKEEMIPNASFNLSPIIVIEASPSIIHFGKFGKIICVEPKLPFREMNSNFQGFMDQCCGPPNFDKNLVNEKCFVQIPHSNQLNIAQQGQLLNLNDQISVYHPPTPMQINNFRVQKQAFGGIRLDSNQQSRLNGLTKFAVELKNFDKSCYEVESRNSQIKKDPLKIYTCKVNNCGKEFKRIQNLVMHLRVHFNVKNYFCQFCTKSFTQKGNLEKHMKQHLKPRLFERKDTECKYFHSKFIWSYNQME